MRAVIIGRAVLALAATVGLSIAGGTVAEAHGAITAGHAHSPAPAADRVGHLFEHHP